MLEVGKNIRKYRIQKNLTQDALAERLHVTRQAVSNWETGKNQPDLAMLEAAAKALDLELEDLLQGKKEEYPRFQTRAIVWVIVLGVLALFLLADELFLAPWLLAWKGRTYRAMPYMINELAVLPFCRLAAGMLLPAIVALWYRVQPGKKVRIALRVLPVLLLIPAALVLLSLVSPVWPPIYRFALFFLSDPSKSRMRLACRVFPFLAGLCLYPAYVRLKRTEPGA